jgi:hypothetical protein
MIRPGRFLGLLLALAPCLAAAQEVARVFELPLSAKDIGLGDAASLPAAAALLRQRAMKAALERFVIEHKLRATDEDLEAYGKWNAEFLRRQGRPDADRPATEAQAASRKRVWSQWITAFKANKALYDKYGGRVGLTKFGPEPIGALEALLRERARSGDLVIADAALAKEFWSWYASQPRRAARPEEIDFTFYWLRPHAPDGARR